MSDKPNGKHDIRTHRIITYTLAGVCGMSMFTMFVLPLYGIEIDPAVNTFGSVALGALANALTSIMKGDHHDDHPPPAPESPDGLAAVGQPDRAGGETIRNPVLADVLPWRHPDPRRGPHQPDPGSHGSQRTLQDIAARLTRNAGGADRGGDANGNPAD